MVVRSRRNDVRIRWKKVKNMRKGREASSTCKLS